MANIFTPPREINVKLPEYLIDLFGRLRTSDPIIQLQVTQSDPTINLIVTEGQVSGTGTTSSYSQATASTTLTVSTTDGLRRYRTRVPGLYQAGKSLLYLFTFNLLDSASLYWTLRSSVTGTIVNTNVARNDWNVDKFDGTGPSGITLDQTKAHIGFIGFEWLGVGDVVCGFIHNRTPAVSHIFKHTNALEGVYMRTANLFPSFEIQRSSGVNTKRLGYYDNSDGVFLSQINGGNNLKIICCSLINEGAIDKTGTTYAITRNPGDNYNTGVANSYRALMLFRLNPSSITSKVIVTGIELVNDTNSNYYLYLVRQPTFSGTVTPTWTDMPNRSIQYDPAPATTGVNVTNALTNAIWVTTASSSNTGNGTTGSFNLNSIDYLGSEYNDVPETWALVICSSTANTVITNALVKFAEEI